MKRSRRIKRMSRKRGGVPKMNLTSLMDVFTILVFFLLVNSATTEVLESPEEITLPASVVEEKPRETVVVLVSPTEVTVQGERVVEIEEIESSVSGTIGPIASRLAELRENVIGINTRKIAQTQEVTILADRGVPFAILKRVMSTCTSEGYERISLAVLQKAPETTLSQL